MTPHATYPHGGHLSALARLAGRAPEDIIDFSASINPLGPPDWLRDELAAAVPGLVHYPDPEAMPLAEAGARRFGLDPAQVAAGNGTTELLHAVFRALASEGSVGRAVIPAPAYVDYAAAARLAGVPVEHVELPRADGFAPTAAFLDALSRRIRPGDVVLLGQPGNPSGRTADPAALRALALAHPEARFVMDEAFADFLPGLERLASGPAGAPGPNMVVLHSLTKFYALPGLRMGLAYAAPDMAARIRRQVPPWSVNTLAQRVGARALADEAFAAATHAALPGLRDGLAQALSAVPGLTALPGQANYHLCRLDAPGMDAPALAHALLTRHGLAVRVGHNFHSLDHRWLRVAVRTEQDNALLLDAMRETLAPQAATARPVPRARRTPAIMVQGTTSNAGKSVLAAALCRCLLQDGFRVAPFKAQNMSLNSFVTRDGLEMGRAQVTQAAACRLEPDARMNPVLLKPSSDTGSQVIVMGRPVANMNVRRYVDYKPEAARAARAAYDELSAGYEVMVLEGAGSPAEINLKADDIVNMAMARHARAHVLLAGDIDRGGVFAALVGTMELLTEAEQSLVAGYVLNKFRGDPSLLDPALAAVTRRTGRPFFGVVPWIHDLGLPEEDSVSFKERGTAGALGADRGTGRDDSVDVAWLDLPHISNFTDMDALGLEPDVHLRVVRRARDLGRPDAVILPGSKNVAGDLDHLRASGLEAALLDLFRSGGVEVVGLCGGFQMLGLALADPLGLESSDGRTIRGMGLLPVTTELARDKTLRRVSGTHPDSGLAVAGYEIHHGRTRAEGGVRAAIRLEDGSEGGLVLDADPSSGRGVVWGTYMHGVFDADAFRRRWLDGLRQRRGLQPLGGVTARYDLEPALNRLADVVRSHLDMPRLYSLLGIL